MGQKRRTKTAKAIRRARRRLMPLLQLHLFENRDEIAKKALAEIKALDAQLGTRRAI
jgi:hypothetical protein